MKPATNYRKLGQFKDLLIASLLLSALGCAEAPSEYVPFQVKFQTVAKLPVADNGEVFRYGKAEQNYLLHRRANKKAPEDPRAAVLFIHGGCWSNRFDLQHANAFADQLANEGYSVWLAEYRRVGDPGGGWPGSLEDVNDAIEFVAQNEPAKPLVLVGHSAGGHLALLAAAQNPAKIDAVMGLAAISRLAVYAQGIGSCPQMVEALIGGSKTQRPAAYAAADPELLPIHPRTWLLQGTADSIVGVEQAALNGAEVELLTNGGHFDWLHPKTAAFGKVLEVLGELSSER